MTVKELKEELECYDDDMNVVFEVCDDFEPDSITESKYGWREVHLDAKVKPCFISESRGEMLIQLDKVRSRGMTPEEFKAYFGMTPERAKQILEELRYIVNQEVHEVIAHADYYIDPASYGYEGKLEKEDENDDGYTCLYDFGDLSGGSVKAFMRLISFHTTHGGHTSAIEACRLMGIEWSADR